MPLTTRNDEGDGDGTMHNNDQQISNIQQGMKQRGASLVSKKPIRVMFYASVGLFAAYLLATFWAIRWVNNHSFQDFPNQTGLLVTRKIWQFTPAFDRERDAERARKLSWLTVQEKIYAKGEKDTKRDILNPLSQEIVHLSDYYKKHHAELPAAEQYRLLAQVMTYLNRVLLYERYPEPRLEKKLNEISPQIRLMTDSDLKENWLRERMINAYLVGSPQQYKTARSDFVASLEHDAAISSNYRVGVIAFFDGIFGCISRQLDDAKSNLTIAQRELPTQFVHNYFLVDLNVLLFGKGMEERSACRPILVKMFQGDSL